MTLYTPQRADYIIICWKIIVTALPFVAYALFSRRLRVLAKVGCLSLYLGILYLFDSEFHRNPGLLGTLGVFGYLALATALLYFSCELVSTQNRAHLALAFGLIAVVYVYVPLILVPHPLTRVVLVIAWEMMFSAYSYFYERVRNRAKSSLNECLFFVLVNPVLVYPEKGISVHGPAVDKQGSFRIVLGVLLVSLSLWVSGIEDRMLRGGWGDLGINPYVGLVFGSGIVFLMEYLAHSGRASLHIGLMRWCGFKIAERYNFPFLATSPDDFWRRWNIYLGSWVKRYVFFGLTMNVRRRTRLSPVVSNAMGIVGAFFVIGVLHDAFLFRRFGGMTLLYTKAFLINAFAFLIWIQVRRLLKQNGERRFGGNTERYGALGRSLSTIIHLHYIFVMIRYII